MGLNSSFKTREDGMEDVSVDSYDIHEAVGLRILPVRADELRQGSSGEVQTQRVFSSDKNRFHADGLFSEAIFGPSKAWTQSYTYLPIQFGHIELPVPVLHPLFGKGLAGNAICAVLGLNEAELEHLLRGWTCVVTDPVDSGLSCGAVVTVDACQAATEKYGTGLKAEHQAEAVRWLLRRATLDASIARAKLHSPDNSGVVRLIRLWFESGHGLDHLVLDVLPVIPPAMRPMQRTASGALRRHDLTCLYQKVLRRCVRIRKLVKLDAPPVILRNEARLLQAAVDRLLVKPSLADEFNPKSRRFKPLLHSLQDSLTPLHEEERTRTWKNSLRLPAAPNPRLPITQCGLPRTVATLEMLAPLWFAHCKQIGLDPRFAEWQLRHPTASVWEVIELQLPRHAVLVRHEVHRSRASVQAFQPRLVDGRAIQLSPLALGALRDSSIQEDVSVLLLQSRSACSQALAEMLPDQCRNPSNGKFAYKPTQDMVLGCFLMTRNPLSIPGDLPLRPLFWGEMAFRTIADVQCALDHGIVSWNSTILFYPDRHTFADEPLCEKVWAHRQRIKTTPGRVIFNDFFPAELPYVNFPVTEKSLGDQFEAVHTIIGATRTRQLLEALQATALAALSQSGLSISLSDLAPPPKKSAILDEANKDVARLRRNYDRGVICPSERLGQTYDAWTKASKILNQEVAIQVLSDSMDPTSLFTAVARTSGSMTWLQHLCGMLGIILPPNRIIHEVAVTSNWGEGLNVGDYWQVVCRSQHLTIDKCERMQGAEQLTRSLLEAMQVVSVTLADCRTTHGIEIIASNDSSLSEALFDRVSCESIVNPVKGEPIVQVGEWITFEIARVLASLNVPKLRVRSPATCEAEHGICQQCYGRDNSTGELVEIGTAVGVIAAFAIGEFAHNLNWYQIREYRAPQIGWVYGTERAECPGKIQFQLQRTVRRQDGRIIALQPGKVLIRDRFRILQEIAVPVGAEVLVPDEAEVRRDDEICKWNTNGVPLIAESAGTVKLCDFVLGENCHFQNDSDSAKIVRINSTRWSLRPHIVILNSEGKPIEAHYLADNTLVHVTDGQLVDAGNMLALQLNRRYSLSDRPSEVQTAFVSDLQDMLEAGPTQETTVLAPCDSVVFSIRRDEKQKTLVLLSEDEMELELTMSRDARLHVQVGDAVKAGDRLTDSIQINPNDVFRILGVEAGIQYVLGRLSFVFNQNRIAIDSKHLELVIGRMLSRVEIHSPGDTDFIAGEVINRDEWLSENVRVSQFVHIVASETTEFTLGQLIRRDVYELLVRERNAQSKAPPTVRRAHPAAATLILSGIQQLTEPHKREQLFGKLSVNAPARFAFSGDVRS